MDPISLEIPLNTIRINGGRITSRDIFRWRATWALENRPMQGDVGPSIRSLTCILIQRRYHHQIHHHHRLLTFLPFPFPSFSLSLRIPPRAPSTVGLRPAYAQWPPRIRVCISISCILKSWYQVNGYPTFTGNSTQGRDSTHGKSNSTHGKSYQI